MTFYQVLLPVAVADTWTYSLPDQEPELLPGVRVLVSLGKSKCLTGILLGRTQEAIPEHLTIKPILQVLDTQPIVREEQIALWKWIADYYMCTLGEVLAAALPGGILDDDFKAATMRYVELEEDYQQESALQSVLNQLHKRSPKQEELLLHFLRLASPTGTSPFAPVERRQLIELSGHSPAILRTLTEKHILRDTHHEVSRLQTFQGDPLPAHPLDSQQQQAFEQIQTDWQEHDVTLLQGVTGSGKTEVYLHLIIRALRARKSVLYLVPEIALTTQLTDRLRAVLGDQLVVYHSRFSPAERVELYHRVLHATEPYVVLGARSAVFLPLQNLSMVIVDEEHENSYKQQDPAPRYHARSVAIMLASQWKAKVLLGTATPSLESYHHAQTGKYGWVQMKQRFRGLQLPRTTLVDLQQQYHRKEMYGHLSDPLVFRMREEIAAGKQVILFLNRRGYAPMLQCPQCGYVPKCGNCDISMTYHKYRSLLSCHYCGYSTSASVTCPTCHQPLKELGMGTERLQEEVQNLFPMARIARMDLDTTRRKDAYQHIIDAFAAHQVDILIGTQMVTKGLHFDHVSLVAVLQADSLVNKPDFRSYEHAYQMLEQVSGRAGRTGQQGEVIIQTFQPSLFVYDWVKNHDYAGMYAQQIAERKQYRYPPFFRLLEITIKHSNYHRVEDGAGVLQQRLHQIFGSRCSVVITPAVGKVQNLYLRHIRIVIEMAANITAAKKMIREQIQYTQSCPQGKGCIIQVDVDPQA